MLVEKRVRFQKYRNWVNAAICGIYFFYLMVKIYLSKKEKPLLFVWKRLLSIKISFSFSTLLIIVPAYISHISALRKFLMESEAAVQILRCMAGYFHIKIIVK